MPSTFLVSLLVVCGILFVFYPWLPTIFGNTKRNVFRLFKVNSKSYSLLGSDLNKSLKPWYFRSDGVGGLPDAVFKSSKKKKILVCDLKAREFNSVVRDNEYFQLNLYMGMAKKAFPGYEVEGRITYKLDTVEIIYNQDVYDALLAMKDEVKSVQSKWRLVNDKPLSKRMKLPKIKWRPVIFSG